MTLIIGARCRDGIVLTADRRRLARYEKGPDTTKLFNLSCGVALAGAGDDAVLNEARFLIDRRIKEVANESPVKTLFDVVEVTASIINELVSYYRDKVEEPVGYVLSGLENLNSGTAKLYTIFGAGLSDVPWACIGSGSTYARPLVDLLLADGNLNAMDAVKVMPSVYTLVSAVQTTVGGGVDICIVKDEEGIRIIQHREDISLKPLRSAVLNALGIQA
jgi:20S proteasome alpha/beta subunit